ncbi:C1-like protein [Artemisia annua]|uniref:C1-like protein n=1 Tax=Artemisia annua TaxID=35608 RepID=A0A2U1MTZ4_ARTAN|nr:C1-like protein [Artemisia annua]
MANEERGKEKMEEINHFGHEEHPLKLIENSEMEKGVHCHRCQEPILGGYVYSCISCPYFLHKTCAEQQPTLPHPFPLTLVAREVNWICNVCLNHYKSGESAYWCSRASVDAHRLGDDYRFIGIIRADFGNNEEKPKGVVVECDLCEEPLSNGDSAMFKTIDHSKFLLTCGICRQRIAKGFFYETYGRDEARFLCCSNCFLVEFACKREYDAIQEKATIKLQHEGHPQHSLTLMLRPACLRCDACKTEEKGLFYECNSCDFWIHETCASLPPTIDLPHHHPKHPIVLVYSLPDKFYKYVYYCKFCNEYIRRNEWLYHCANCRYFAHIKCALNAQQQPSTPRDNPSTSAASDNEISLLHFPMSEAFTDPLKLLHSKIIAQDDKETTEINHWSHPAHSLVLNVEDSQGNNMMPDINSGDPIKVCYACVRPLSYPYYSCKEDGCSVFTDLYKYCAHLPRTLQHLLHPNHTLHLVDTWGRKNFYKCNGCFSWGNTFAYRCGINCEFYVCVNCAFLPRVIKHESHNHPLTQLIDPEVLCNACNKWHVYISYACKDCDFILCMYCAMRSPKSLAHRYCKGHEIPLTYVPVDDHPEDFYCDICEEEMNPNFPLYHCHNHKSRSSFHLGCISRIDYYANMVSLQHQHFRVLVLAHAFESTQCRVLLKAHFSNHNLVLAYQTDPVVAHCPCKASAGNPFGSTHLGASAQPASSNSSSVFGQYAGPFVNLLMTVNQDSHLLDQEKATIKLQHEGHPQHSLTLMLRPASLRCDACKTEEKGLFYECNSCDFWIHETCASLPPTINLPHHHPKHPLVLVYSLPDKFYKYVYYCKFCNEYIRRNEWLYHCANCRYFAHIKCALNAQQQPSTPRDNPSTSAASDNEISLLHFPMSEAFTDPLKLLHSKIIAQDDKETTEINHWSHPAHSLVLNVEDSQGNNMMPDINSGDPIKNIITSTSPKSHPSLGRHMGTVIKHESHNHPLNQLIDPKVLCNACNKWHVYISYACKDCDFILGMYCAMRSPKSLAHRYCKGHEIPLTYLSVDDHPEDFYCDICEEEMNPNFPLYHCHNHKSRSSFHLGCISRIDYYANVVSLQHQHFRVLVLAHAFESTQCRVLLKAHFSNHNLVLAYQTDPAVAHCPCKASAGNPFGSTHLGASAQPASSNSSSVFGQYAGPFVNPSYDSKPRSPEFTSRPTFSHVSVNPCSSSTPTNPFGPKNSTFSTPFHPLYFVQFMVLDSHLLDIDVSGFTPSAQTPPAHNGGFTQPAENLKSISAMPANKDKRGPTRSNMQSCSFTILPLFSNMQANPFSTSRSTEPSVPMTLPFGSILSQTPSLFGERRKIPDFGQPRSGGRSNPLCSDT